MLAGLKLRTHVVEFVRGTGVITDGVVDATSLNGPWTWVVPDCIDLEIDATSAGGGGGGGYTGAAGGGGGGGASGMGLKRWRPGVRAGQQVTVTLGAKGLGGALGVQGTAGGRTLLDIDGVRARTLGLANPTGAQPGNATTGGNGGMSPAYVVIAGGAAAGTAAGQSAMGGGTDAMTYVCPGGPGGGAGYAGGMTNPINLNAGAQFGGVSSGAAAGGGGGGGAGGISSFGSGAYGGQGGRGGAGQAAGSVSLDPTAWGAGGGGGGSNGVGAAGLDGYARITYTSLD